MSWNTSSTAGQAANRGGMHLKSLAPFAAGVQSFMVFEDTSLNWLGLALKARALVLGLGVTGSALSVAAGDLAQAQSLTCAQVVVTARGEEARYEWLARTKARANWRARVRAMPELGAPFANWARATNTQERCLSGSSGTVCTLSGTPCRP